MSASPNSTPPAPAPASTENIRRPCRPWRWILKFAYAIATGFLSLWIASFTPSEGPSIFRYLPASQAGFIVHIRSGAELFSTIQTNRAWKELQQDPDFKTIFADLIKKKDEIGADYRQLPTAAHWLLGADSLDFEHPNAFLQLIGNETAVAVIPPGNDSRPATLALVRVSGGLGHAAKIVAHFVKPSKNLHIYDLGGDLLAFGIDGARPELSVDGAHHKAPAIKDDPASQPLADVLLHPANLTSPAKVKASKKKANPKENLDSGNDVTNEYPPATIAEMLNLKQAPAEIAIRITSADGGLRVTGYIDGFELNATDKTQPGSKDSGQPIKTSHDPQDAKAPFIEAALPFNARACFMTSLHNQLSSSRRRRRWFSALDYIESQALDLDRDLWPAFGHVATLTFQETPENLTLSQYGWITGSIAFNGKSAKAREAMDELPAGFWDMVEANESNSPPYVKRVVGKHAERFMLFTKFILAPTWTVSADGISFVSDGGPFVLLKQRANAEPDPLRPDPKDYFIRLHGMPMACKIEAWVSMMYQDEEEDLGAKEFSRIYPDVPARIRLATKLTCLLGDLSLSVSPHSNGENVAAIQAIWTPGTLAGLDAKAKVEDDAPPPPQ